MKQHVPILHRLSDIHIDTNFAHACAGVTIRMLARSIRILARTIRMLELLELLVARTNRMLARSCYRDIIFQEELVLKINFFLNLAVL